MNLLTKFDIVCKRVFGYVFYPGYLVRKRITIPISKKWSNTPKPLVGASYNLFDGEELLEDSILSIRKAVQHISVVFQVRSHWGNAHPNPNMIRDLENLKQRGLIDSLIIFDPSRTGLDSAVDNKTFHQFDVEKRNLGIRDALTAGCSLFISLDSDELYSVNQFQYMVDVMTFGKYEASAVKHIQYYKSNRFIKRFSEQEYVSGIIKIGPETKFVYNFECPYAIDPARKPNVYRYRKFRRFEIEMHHLSFVRLDIATKFVNHGAREDVKSGVDAMVNYFNAWHWPQPGMWAGNKAVSLRKIRKRVDIKTFENLSAGNKFQ